MLVWFIFDLKLLYFALICSRCYKKMFISLRDIRLEIRLSIGSHFPNRSIAIVYDLKISNVGIRFEK